MLRSYIGREWERIEKIREISARKELDEYLDPAAVENGPKPPPPPPPLQRDAKVAESYRVLGLKRDASLQQLKEAYAKLSERSLPTNFPEGSDERKKASNIHLLVQEAYDLLLPVLDPRLRRFQTLDID
ncbi:MAG: hypothetical protein ACR2HJ_10055 [Fimbriimonadales bacterium]